MQLLLRFARRYPIASVLTVLALLFASIAEGFGITVMLPILDIIVGQHAIVTKGGGIESSRIGSELIRIVRDALGSMGMAPTMAVLLLVFMVCIIVKCVLVLLANRQVGYTVAHIATDLRLTFLRALFASRWEYFLRQPVGRLTNAVSSEAGRSAAAFSTGAKMASTAVESLVYVVLAFLVSWKATFLAITVGLLMVFALRRYVRKARNAGRRQTRLLQSLIAQMTDSLQSIKSLKAMAREDSADTVLKDKTTKLNRALQKQVFSKAALSALQEPLMVAFVLATLYFALVHLSIKLTTVVAMIYLIRKVLKNVQKIQQDYQDMATQESAYWSLQQKVDQAHQEREQALGRQAPTLSRAIRFEDVSFKYDRTWILKNVHLALPAGAFIALVGPSGAGKTTVADLAIGLLSPQEGNIWIDDSSLKDLDIRRWRRMIGYVPQEVLLLHDSVFVNVTLGDKGLKEEDVERALRAAGAWDFVAAAPKGIHTIVGERGGMVSGGQRQRIAIARALVNNPKLLVLDEATTALDPETELAICATLRELRGNVTILAISHQSAMLEAADVAYQLENGRVVLVKNTLSGLATKMVEEYLRLPHKWHAAVSG